MTDTLTGLAREVEAATQLRTPAATTAEATAAENTVHDLARRIEAFAAATPNLDPDTHLNLLTRLARKLHPGGPRGWAEVRDALGLNERDGRCPDGGYCHGETVAAGSPPCPPGACYRVRNAGPLSGVYPGDRWPDDVLAAHEVPPARKPTDDEFRDIARLQILRILQCSGERRHELVDELAQVLADLDESAEARGRAARPS